jgi:hypothetical protein
VQAIEDESADWEMADEQRKELQRLRHPDRQYSFVDGKLRVEGRFETTARRVPKTPKKPVPAKIAKRLALAHQVEGALRSGKFRTSAAAARAFGMSPSETTRLLVLTLLAPDIQEEILLLEAIDGVEPEITERALRPIATIRTWADQRRAFDRHPPAVAPRRSEAVNHRGAQTIRVGLWRASR